jgi:ATP-dependent RNA helicase DeaD
MAEGSVWFRAAIGRRKNAEARWLLPMICRRGGIDKNDIGAIRIMDTTTEFEISERVAESFAASVRRPDKEDNIRIEAMADAPQAEARPEKRSHPPRRETGEAGRDARPSEKPRDERGPKQYAKPHGGSGSRFVAEPGFKQKRRQGNPTSKPTYAGHKQQAGASAAKPAFGKKKKEKRRG